MTEGYPIDNSEMQSHLFLDIFQVVSFFLILQKIQNLVMLPGMTTDHTLLNVVRSQGPGKSIDAILIDNLENISGSVIAKSGASTHHSNYFSQLDFDIGITINIAGRDVLLYDCDDFTRKYYRQVLKRGKSMKENCLNNLGIIFRQIVLKDSTAFVYVMKSY